MRAYFPVGLLSGASPASLHLGPLGLGGGKGNTMPPRLLLMKLQRIKESMDGVLTAGGRLDEERLKAVLSGVRLLEQIIAYLEGEDHDASTTGNRADGDDANSPPSR